MARSAAKIANAAGKFIGFTPHYPNRLLFSSFLADGIPMYRLPIIKTSGHQCPKGGRCDFIANSHWEKLPQNLLGMKTFQTFLNQMINFHGASVVSWNCRDTIKTWPLPSSSLV